MGARTRRRALAALACAALPACTLTDVAIPISEDVVVVEAVLRTDAAVQRIVLHRAVNGRVVPGVSDADVIVTGGPSGRVALFREGGDECYRYSGAYFEERPGAIHAVCYEAEFPVVAGAAYDLRVQLPDGRAIRGRTWVPVAFALRGMPAAYHEDDRFTARCWMPPDETLALGWTESGGAWAYLAPLRVSKLRQALAARGIVVDAPDVVELNGLAVSSGDTTLVLPTDFGVFDRFTYEDALLQAIQGGFPPGVVLDLAVVAADRNYVNGVRGGSFNPSGPVRVSSVVGDGVGVFGSIVPAYVRIEVSGGPGEEGGVRCGEA